MTNSGEFESLDRLEDETDSPDRLNETLPWEDVPAEPIFDDVPQPAMRTPRQIGPGFWESIGWIVGFFVIEVCGSFAWSLVASLVLTVTTGEPTTVEQIRELYAQQAGYILGAIKLAEVVLILAAIRWRFGRDAFRLTGFRRPPAVHVSILVLMLIPAAVFSGQLYAVLSIGWQYLMEIFPIFERFDVLSSMDVIQQMVETTPLVVLIFAVAVFPALNEEFLFRGLMGRGLVGRYGIASGVAITSLLFAAVHLNPVHVAALIPLAVVFHVAYLSSRSIWLSVLAHFLNNALSVVVMVAAARSAGNSPNVAAGAIDGHFAPEMLIASACCVFSAMWLLWRLRAQWQLPNGDRWTAPEPGVAAPPAEMEARPVIVHGAAIPALAMMLSLVLFAAAVAVTIFKAAGI